MPAQKSRTSSADSLALISTVALTAFVISMLYFAQDILVPLALAALLTFLLAPMVNRIERWVGRVTAVLVVVLMLFAGFGAAGWVLTQQVIDLATKLPDYKENIVTKLHSFRTSRDGKFSKFSETVEELKKELPGGENEQSAPVVQKEVGKPETATSSPPAAPPAPAVPVKVVETSTANPMDLMASIVAPILGPLGTAALVLLLVIFMLLKREDLRGPAHPAHWPGPDQHHHARHGRRRATRRTLSADAARGERHLRHSRVAIGLVFIGVPNAMLWGCFATVLRFMPYVGPWIAAVIPIALSLAVSPAWTMPLMTIGLVHRARADQQQRDGALALRLEHRRFLHRADRRGGVLDVALGPGRAGACDAPHRLPRGDGTACAAARFSQRSAER